MFKSHLTKLITIKYALNEMIEQVPVNDDDSVYEYINTLSRSLEEIDNAIDYVNFD